MKKFIKRIFLYIGVALISLFATAVLCAGFLFFYRDGNIFGFQYISGNNTLYAKSDMNLSATEKIEVYGKNFDVIVRGSDNVDNLVGVMKSKVFGYTRKSKNKLSFTLNYSISERKAVFTAEEPTGWLANNGSYIIVMIPRDVLDNNCQISIKSNKGDITLGGDDVMTVGECSIQSSKGDFTAQNVEFTGAVALSAGKGKFRIEETCTTMGAIDFKVGVGSGRILLNKLGEGFEIERFEIEKITKGEIYLLKAGEICTTGDIKGGGKLVVHEIVSANFTSQDTDVSIDEIVGTVQSKIKLTGSGDAKIVKCKCDLFVEAHDGNVTVENALGKTTVTANQGNINMPSATLYVSAESTYGNINITFNSAAGNYSSSDEVPSRSVFASTMNGHITVKGLQNGVIRAGNKGRIDVVYDKVCGNNVVTGANGNVNIIVPAGTPSTADCAFKLIIEKTDVNCDILVGAFSWDKPAQSKIEREIYNDAGASHSNVLTVQSGSGTIKMRSSDLA